VSVVAVAEPQDKPPVDELGCATAAAAEESIQ
jgi:hypothetical protein